VTNGALELSIRHRAVYAPKGLTDREAELTALLGTEADIS
jgi:hypothetical protein